MNEGVWQRTDMYVCVCVWVCAFGFVYADELRVQNTGWPRLSRLSGGRSHESFTQINLPYLSVSLSLSLFVCLK